MRRAAPLGGKERHGVRGQANPDTDLRSLQEAEAIAVLANSESTVSLPEAFALIGTQAGCFIRSDVFRTGNAGLIHSRMEGGAAAPLRCMLTLPAETLQF
jgi:hypothetical protein